MSLELSSAQVESLAPDAAALLAGRKLAQASAWSGLGHSERAFWGECQGSALYQTRVARVDLAAKCSCPSRKFPCKHGLGLMLLAAAEPSSFPAGAEPEWVKSWLDQRREAASKPAAPRKPVDAVAQSKRADKRRDNVLAGLDGLEAWMADLLRQGLARAQSQSFNFWDNQARRLVDAQAPGLASRVRWMGARVAASEDWAARLLDDLGTLALLAHAYRKVDELEPGLAADVRRLVGHSMEAVEVVAHGDLVDDDWTVLGEVTEDDERLSTQRAWLRGARSGRNAMVLQFSAGGGRFAETLAAGTRFAGRLAFWPSAAPQRALIAERKGEAKRAPEAPRGESVRGALERYAAALGKVPWLEREAVVLDAVTLRLGEGASAQLVDGEGLAMPLYGQEHEELLALSGGHPMTVLGEWDGYGLRVLKGWKREPGVNEKPGVQGAEGEDRKLGVQGAEPPARGANLEASTP
jgi:hypothetical protein